MRSAEETAIVLAVILNRNGESRARVSVKTLRLAGNRFNLRAAFVRDVIDALAEFSWIMFEISTGGYGAVKSKALEAAKSVTAKRMLTDKELKAIQDDGKVDWAKLRKEAMPDPEPKTDEE